MSIRTYFESSKSYWLRWICVLPLAIIAFFLTSLVFKTFFNFLGIIFHIVWIKRYLVTFLAGTMSGVYFILAGYFVTPKYKKPIILILFAIMVLYLGYITILGYTNEEYSPITENIAATIGITYATYKLYNKAEYKEDRLNLS